MTEAFDTVETLAAILSEHGPLHLDDIVRRLREAGAADSDIPDAASLEMACPVRQLTDGRWVWLPTLLVGRVFTHRLSADETAHDMLTMTPDLDPITTLCEHTEYQRLADGSAAQTAVVDYDDELFEERGIPPEAVATAGALLLEPGTLAKLGATEGDLVGVRLTAPGLTLERITMPGLNAGAAMGARLAKSLDPDEPTFFPEAVWTICVEDPEAFMEPLPPLGGIADDYGLARQDESLAPAGFDFDAWRFEARSALLAQRHGLEPDDAVALYALIQLHDQMSMLLEAADDEPPPLHALADEAAAPTDDTNYLMGELGDALLDPLLADLLLHETVDIDPAAAAALGMLAEVLEPKVPRAARVACRWLRAVALERLGDVEANERELLAAESMDPDWPLVLVDLARIASDRGDAERGLALLRRAGADPDHPLVELLEKHHAEPRSDLGRNEPCWCGSGRKYKKCHLGREQLPLAERADWLYTKATQHVELSAWNDLRAEMALERCRYVDPDDDDALAEALADPLVMDAVLFEGGAFADFLEVRGSLLPDDERSLAEQWLLVERSVFEVEQVHRGQGITVRDVRSGDTHEVRERMGSRQLQPGQLICARVVPTGEIMQIFGGLEPVALHDRDELIELLDDEPDAVTLAAALTRRFAPPMLTNTEGDPLAMCEATVRVAPGMETALDDAYDRVDGEEPPRWFEHVTTHGMPRIRATLVLDGDTLRVQANSEERMDRVLATLARLDPGVKILDESRIPVPDAREAAKLAKQMPMTGEGTADPDDPEVAAMLAEFIREYETKWLDEPIPALDGHTPRQAADDPTRRSDLIKLLDTFPSGDAARGGMDADRLRAALGLR